MSVSVEGSGSNLDFDLNLAPIIDCFTVLITYLLVSASFLTLTVFDVGVAANGEADAAQQEPLEPPLSMDLELTATKTISIHISGGPEKLDLNYAVAGTPTGAWDIESVKAKLQEIRTQWPTLEEANISAESAVKYKELIKMIEELKKVMPKVFIAG